MAFLLSWLLGCLGLNNRCGSKTVEPSGARRSTQRKVQDGQHTTPTRKHVPVSRFRPKSWSVKSETARRRSCSSLLKSNRRNSLSKASMLTWQVWGPNGRLNTVTNCRDNRPAGVNTAANSFWELAVAPEAQLTTPLAAIWWQEWTPVIHPVTILPWAATAPIISTSTSLERTSTSMGAMTTSNISTSRYLNWTSFNSSNRITINIIRRRLRRRTIASSSDISQSNCWRVVHLFRHRPPFPLK